MPVLREDLRFGTSRHKFLVEAVLRRKRFSQETMHQRHDKWKKDDDAFIAFMPEKEADKTRRQLRENAGQPQFTTLKIPFDYAVLMSAHTYWTSVFLGRNPIFQFQGRQGQAQSAVLAVEAMMDYQATVGRMLPIFYSWLLDVGKYGVGVTGSFWDNEKVVVNREIDVPQQFLGVDLGQTKKEMRRFLIDGYQGNKLYNVRPYDFIHDPHVTMQNLQEGEFCGRYTQVGWNSIAKGAAADRYFNVEVLRQQRAKSVSDRFKGSPQIVTPIRPGEATHLETFDLSAVELLEMYIELIPRDWGLGNSTFPEKWVFVIANDQVLIAAQPLGDYHNKFPFYVLEYEPDAYALFKRSMLEIIGPMTDVITWLVNTHFYNTRKSLNDMFVVDPSKIVVKDIKDPNPGKIIRLKEEMYGQDVRNAIWQFPVNNVTQQHLQDTQFVAGLIQRVSGVNDNIMGLLNQGGRKTATEVRTSSTFGINRLKTTAEWFSATGFSDMASTLLQMTQQHYTGQMKLRLAGDLFQQPGAENFVELGPGDIQGFFDFSPVDGTLPVDRFAQVNMWSTLLQQMGQAPEVLAQYDLGKIFGWVAQLAGLKNINQFRIDIQPRGVLEGQAQAGNVIPFRSSDGNSRATTQPTPGAEGNTPPPAQVAGVGPSG